MRMPSPADGRLPPLVGLVGPTAVGKTGMSVRLAEEFGGEIVSADSRQVYRFMDIGTAKPSSEQRSLVPHHLLDVVDPDQSLSLAQFQEMAYAAVEGIVARGQLPLLVGGTGQYVMAVAEGWQVPRVPPDDALREELYRKAREEGAEAVHALLWSRDPVAAERIDPRNVRRVIRALEVSQATGRPFSAQQHKLPPPYRLLIAGLTLRRPLLYRRIDARVEAMMAAGLEGEVRGLIAAGYGFDLPAMSGVGYGQFAAYFAGEATLADVEREIERATRRFVRHQSNWFRADDPRIHWFEAEPDPYPAVAALIHDFLGSSPPESRS